MDKARSRVTRTRRIDQLGKKVPGGSAMTSWGSRRLKAAEGPELHLWGSSELLQTLIGAGLIDEYRLWVYPVVLGQGKRLFADRVPPAGLALVQTRSTPAGVLLSTYRPAGPAVGVGSADQGSEMQGIRAHPGVPVHPVGALCLGVCSQAICWSTDSALACKHAPARSTAP